MAKLQSTEIVGVANRPATICTNTLCFWFDTTNSKPMVSYCGYLPNAWSAVSSLINIRQYSGGAGTQSAGLAIGGYGAPQLSCTEEYNKP